MCSHILPTEMLLVLTYPIWKLRYVFLREIIRQRAGIFSHRIWKINFLVFRHWYIMIQVWTLEIFEHGFRHANCDTLVTWWRHQMETFSALLVLCEGNPPVTGGFPSQRGRNAGFGVFIDVSLNKRLNKQSITVDFRSQDGYCDVTRMITPSQLIRLR